MRPGPPGWGPLPRPGWGYPYPPLPGPRRPELGAVTVLVLVTVLAALAAPHARVIRGKLAGAGGLPAISLPKLPAPPPTTRAPAGLSFTNRAGCRPVGDWASPRLDRRVRQLVVARNERRLRQGKEELDVDAEVERQLRELENLGQ